MKPSNVLILPGWQNSGPQHWQSLWEERHGYVRVEQHDWMRPLRGDWLARLEERAARLRRAAVLVAHSLGCILAAAWAAHSQQHAPGQGALLVAPRRRGAARMREQIPPGRRSSCGACLSPACWWPAATTPIATSSARACSRTPGARRFMDYGECGHINADSGLASWPEGHVLLQDCFRPERSTRSFKTAAHGDQETQGPGPRPRSAARPHGRRRAPPTAVNGTTAGLPRIAAARRHGARHLPAAHAHGRGRALRTGREHQGAGHHAADPGAPAGRRRPAPGTSTKSSPASAAFAPPGWPAWTACRCWCATCPTKRPRRCR